MARPQKFPASTGCPPDAHLASAFLCMGEARSHRHGAAGRLRLPRSSAVSAPAGPEFRGLEQLSRVRRSRSWPHSGGTELSATTAVALPYRPESTTVKPLRALMASFRAFGPHCDPSAGYAMVSIRDVAHDIPWPAPSFVDPSGPVCPEPHHRVLGLVRAPLGSVVFGALGGPGST